jgi:hypothetical protein
MEARPIAGGRLHRRSYREDGRRRHRRANQNFARTSSVSAAVTASRLTPTISTIFRRPVSPATTLMFRLRRPNFEAMNSINSAFAALSTGGAATRIFQASPYIPATPVRDARG